MAGLGKTKGANTYGPPKSKPAPKTPVAGPYRSQSSVPKIRESATSHEHRKIKRVAPPTPNPFGLKPIHAPTKAERHVAALRKSALRGLGAHPGPTGHGTPGTPAVPTLSGIKPGSHDSWRPDPTALAVERGVIRPLQEEGKLPKHPTTGQQIYQKIAEYGPTAITLAPELKAAGSALKAATAGVESGGMQVGGSKLLSRILTPTKATTPSEAAAASARLEESAALKAGSGVKGIIKRAGAAATRSESKANAALARQLTGNVTRKEAAAAAGFPLKLTKAAAAVGGSKRIRGAVEGTAKAIIHHPGETAKTTLRSVPASITAPAALLGAAGESIIQGSPKPLEKTASEQAKGVAHIASQALSGDPKKAEEAARKEGSVAFVLPLVPAVSKTRLGEGTMGEIRSVSSAARRAVATSEKLPFVERRNRIRHAPKGTEEHALALSARHHQRKRTAVRKARVDNPHKVEIVNMHNALTEAGAKVEKKYKGAHNTHQVLAEYGIRNPHHAQFLREHGPKDPELTKALNWLDKHPEYFSEKGHAPVMDALRRNEKTLPATKVEKGERARLMQQGDLFGIQRPEHMSPIPGYKSRAEAWNALQTREARLKELERKHKAATTPQRLPGEGRQYKPGSEPGAAKAARRQREIDVLTAQHKKMFDVLDKYTRPDHSIDRSDLRAYSDEMLKTYAGKVEGRRKAEGYDRAIWTAHASGRGGGLENPYPAPMGNLEHMREGHHAAAGELDRSFEGLVRGTVHMPRLKASAKELGRSLGKERLAYTWDGKKKYMIPDQKTWDAITSPKTKDNPNGGQYDPKSVGRFALRDIKNAIEDPFASDEARSGSLNTILAEAEHGRVKGHAPSLLLPREVIKEARAQITPPDHGILNKSARGASHLLLGTNPAWAISQIAAEGIPLLMAQPSLALKFPLYEHFLKQYGKDHPENALSARATAGASPIRAGANLQPRDIQETYTPQTWVDGAKGLTRGETAKKAISFAKLETLGKFDVRRQNEYRTLSYLSEADKRHLQTFHSSLTGLFDHEVGLSRKFKTREELHQWLEHDPKGKVAKQKIEDYVDNIQGNWTAFSRYEMKYAPAVLFYPFLRYSLRWPLWAFPKEHPIKATIAYTLGQANSNQLEALVGGPLENALGYAYPVFNTSKVDQKKYQELLKEKSPPTSAQAKEIASHSILPAGTRISPGQSNITQALQSGNVSNLLSSANPVIGAGITALTGHESFTDRQVKERGYAALEGLIELPRPASIPLPFLGGKSAAQAAISAIGGGKEQSVASKAYGKYDKNRLLRSFVAPWISESGRSFYGTEHLSKGFKDKYSNPVPSLPAEVWEAAYNHDWKAAKKLRARRLEAEKGSAVVKQNEKQFYPPSGELGRKGSEILQYITGQIVLKPEESKRDALAKHLGIPAAPSKAQLQEELGLPATPSRAQLEKELGL